MFRRPQQGGSCVHVIFSIKKKKNCDILRSDLFPWQEPWLITSHSFSHCASVTQKFTGWPGLHGFKTAEKCAYCLAWASTAMNVFINWLRIQEKGPEIIYLITFLRGKQDRHDNITMPHLKEKKKSVSKILCITTEDFLLTHEKWDDL